MAKKTFFRLLLTSLYGAAWSVARPVLKRHPRLKEGFAWRLVPDNWSGPVQKIGKGEAETLLHAETDIWLQAASGGEAYLVWEILNSLIARQERLPTTPPPLRVLVTTWTRQGLEVLQGMSMKLAKAHPWLRLHPTFFPLDSPSIMARALDQAKPRVVGLLETELWPGLMLACKRRNIPMLVLNGRMTEKSLKGYLRLDTIEPHIWADMRPQAICAISKQDGARFAALFGKDCVNIVPNIKFDRSAPTPGTDVSALHTLLPPDRHAGRTVLLASVREQEEQAVMQVIEMLRSKDAPTIIIAPRHMHRVAEWLKRTQALAPLRRSKQEGPIPAGSLVIWDTFGELGQLYQLADAVFVGGSLAPLGGQNFLEPLALGKVPCCGPHLDNFAWALSESAPGAADSLEGQELLAIGKSPRAIANILQTQIAKPLAPEAVREHFEHWLAPRRGGADRSAEKLLETLEG